MGYVNNLKKNFKLKYYINYLVIIAILVALIVISGQGQMKRATTTLLIKISYTVIMALSLNLVVGFLGELSLGHGGFMCIGAYIGCYCANLMSSAIGNKLVVLIIAMAIGAVAAAVSGLIIGLPALRLKGDYLAIVTLAFGEIVRCVFMNLPWFDQALGMTVTNKFRSKELFTLLVVGIICVLVVLFLSQNFIRSKHGRAVTAIRDNEIASRAMGINVTFYKLLVFVISAAFAGVAGVLYGHSVGLVDYAKFSYNYSIEILVIVVLGGMGSLNGSMIAAVAFTWINFKLQDKLSGDMANFKNLAYAIVLMAIVLYNNAPALTAIKEKLSIRQLWLRYSLKRKPGAVFDDAAAWNKIPTKIPMDEHFRVDVRKEEALPAQDETGKEGSENE